MKNVLAGILVLGVLAAAALEAQQNPMRPGRWQVSMQMEMANMPMQMPAMTTTQCVTEEMMKKDPASGLPQGVQSGSRDGACKVSDYKIDGSTITWKMACTGQQAMTADGTMTFSGDSYTGATKMTTPQGPMSMKMTGKRLSDCTQ